MNNQSSEGVAIKKVTNVFSKKILAKRALREIKLLQHFRGHRNVSSLALYCHKSTSPYLYTRLCKGHDKRDNRLTVKVADHLLV